MRKKTTLPDSPQPRSATVPRIISGVLNALHPFREGNGRAQREFVSHLANATGYYIAWENVSQQDMLEASIQSFNGDTSKLAAIIRENLHSLDQDASTPTRARKQEPDKPTLS